MLRRLYAVVNCFIPFIYVRRFCKFLCSRLRDAIHNDGCLGFRHCVCMWHTFFVFSMILAVSPLRTLSESCTVRAVMYLMAAEFRCAFPVSAVVEIDVVLFAVFLSS